ncbi:unnamed protein product, partial [Ectocarpus sp. 13 AM-2016]
YTLLHKHAHDGDDEGLDSGLGMGLDVDAVDAFGATPIMHAAQEGHLSIVRRLCWRGADVTVGDLAVGATVLHLAAKGEHCSVLKALSSAWLDVDVRDHENETPLFDAVENGQLPATKTLIALGADCLINAGADVHTGNTNGGRTALHFAACQGGDEMIGALLAGGAGIDALDDCGATPLMLAATEGQLSVVKALLSAGANVNFVIGVTGRTPLHWAAIGGREDAVDAILSAGGAKDTFDNNGDIPLMWACKGGHLSVIKALLSAGA